MSSLMLIVHLSDNRPCNRQRVSADLVLMVRELSSVTFGHLYLFFFEVCVCESLNVVDCICACTCGE